jgi:hypothetical protein
MSAPEYRALGDLMLERLKPEAASWPQAMETIQRRPLIGFTVLYASILAEHAPKLMVNRVSGNYS